MIHPQYLLDTSAVVDLMRNPDGIVARGMDKAGGVVNCAISDVTLFELYSGAYSSQDVEKNLVAVERLTKWLAVIPSACGYREAAMRKVELRRQGMLIEDLDILIGCTAIASDRILVTANVKHFERLKGIQLENWQR